MGAKVAKPNPPQDNVAKANADLAFEALSKNAEVFLADVQMGRATIQNLGYKLAGGKLSDQEIKIMVQEAANVTREDVANVVNAVFSGDWQTVVTIAASAMLPFLSGDIPKPADRALNESWAKSFLVWEHNSLVQYSIYLKRTNATSTGLLTENASCALLACACRGIIAYESVDPQVIVFELSETYGSSMSTEEFSKLIATVKQQMQLANDLIMEKRKLIASSTLATGA